MPRWLPRWNARAARQAVAELDQVLNAIIEKRQAEGSDREDLLSLFMQAHDPVTGEAMSASLLRDEAAVIILAGHETTANALCWTWYLLSRHPEGVVHRLGGHVALEGGHDVGDRAVGNRHP